MTIRRFGEDTDKPDLPHVTAGVSYADFETLGYGDPIQEPF